MFVRAYPRGLRGAIKRLLEKPAARASRQTRKFENWPELEEIDDSGAKLTGVASGKLGDMLDHPELYARRPNLRNIPVRLTDSESYSGAATVAFPGFRNIKLSRSYTQDPRERLSTLLHETQHISDSIDRVGRSKVRVGDHADYWRSFPEVLARAVERRRPLNKASRAQLDPFEKDEFGIDIQPWSVLSKSVIHPEDFALLAYGSLGVSGSLMLEKALRKRLEASRTQQPSRARP